MFKLDGPTLRRAMQEHFDAGTLAKGRVYYQQRRVRSCEVGFEPDTGWVISADVRGSLATPYEVRLELFDDNGALAIEGECTCPMEFDCKHTVAALMHVADQPENWFDPAMADSAVFPFRSNQAVLLPGNLNPQLQSWLKEISDAAAKNAADPGAQQTEEEPERLLYILQPQNGRLKLELSVARVLKKGGYGPPRRPIHPPPQEGGGDQGTAAQNRDRAKRRTRRRAARPVRERAPGDARARQS